MQLASTQIEALGHEYGHRFVAQVCNHLRAAHAERLAEVQENPLQEFVRRGVARARGHGLASERDILRFIECQLRFGAEFDCDRAYAWARSILAMPVDGTHRMNTLQTYEREFLASPRTRPANAEA